MNVRSQMNATSMLCVPIQRVLMSVDVEKVLKAMEETAQVARRVRHYFSPV